MEETRQIRTGTVTKPSSELSNPSNHVLVLIDFEGQMGFPVKSISINDLRLNAAILAGSSTIFNVPTVVSTVLENVFSGPVFPEMESFYPRQNGNYIDRSPMNSWEDEKAYQAIVNHGKRKLVLAGLWTSVCIVDPALSALADGYEVYVVADACGDVSEEAHERAMQRMIQLGVKPITAIQYLLELQRDWARQGTYEAVTGLMKQYGGAYGLGIHYAHNMLKH